MLTNKQKKSFKSIAIISLILSLVALVPFRAFGSSSLIHGIEVGVKLLFIPLMMALISIKANIMKYRELKVNRYRSKVVNVMSYFPLTVYLVSLLVFTIQTMTISGEGVKATTPLGLGLWNALFVALVVYICYLIIQLAFISKITLNFSEKKLQIFDISFVVISVFLIFISGSIITAYFDNFKSFEFYRKGNVLLLIIFVVGYLVAYFTGRNMKRFIDESEELLVTDMKEIISGNPSELTIKTEYQHALNDILNDFSKYYENGGNTATETSENGDEVSEDTPQDVLSEDNILNPEVEETKEEESHNDAQEEGTTSEENTENEKKEN